ncbi:MAG: V-type ATPase 116kDa subunit family protein [Bacteroidales bacterium]
MTKYSFVIFHKEVDEFLQNLQNLGVVDVTRQHRAIDTYSLEKFEEIARYNAAVKSLKSTLEAAVQKGVAIPSDVEASGDILKVYETKLSLKEELSVALKETKAALFEAQPWGVFTQENFDKIKKTGLIPHFYTMSEKRFNPQWEQEYPLHIINTENGKIYFTILQTEGEPYSFKEQECKFPDTSANMLEEQIALLNGKIESNDKELLSTTNLIEQFEERKQELFLSLDLYLANTASQKQAEETIVIFEGFAPTEIDKQVDKYLEDHNIYYLKDAAKTEDNPPVKLKNNFFGKLYEPIGELYMLPKYGELDLTLFFAPFYMLFFGFCLGDMGYGFILLTVGLIVNFKVPKFSNYGKLVAFLGLGAIIMPALSGTFFGMKLYDLLPMPENIKQLFFSDMKMFWFAIIFGLVQIVCARLINAIYMMKTKGFTAGLHNIGWSILIIWGSVWYASTEMNFIIPAWANYAGYIGLALIVIFTSNHKNFIIRLFKGGAALYDVTGVFGDMLSYIRLFGLATSGGILGLVVNSVAMQMSGIPYIGWFFTVLMLLIGHTAVLFLSGLGAFVHPMRLTFVEFYKNAGFEGGGRAYSPLAKTKQD